MQGRLLAAVALLAACLAGCDPAEREPPVTQPEPASIGAGFDPATAGTVTGTVRWLGERPVVPPLVAHLQPQGPPPLAPAREWPNPHAPRVGPDGEVQGAVVFLRAVDPVKSRPWKHPPVAVEQAEYQYLVRQGERTAQVGFVRCGDAVTMEAADEKMYSLHARGAAYFSLRFAEPNRPVTRVLKKPGVVELTSGMGCVWMRAYLFVAEHPYYTVTDESGRFTLPEVPAGGYEVVCWLPNYRVTGRDLDPNTALPVRLTFAPPVTKARQVAVVPGRPAAAPFTLALEDFGAPAAR